MINSYWGGRVINRRAVLNVLAGVGSAIGAGSVLGAPLGTVLDAKPFAQTKTWSCWAAAAVILLEWKNKIPISELQMAQMAGPNYVAAFNGNTGLNGTEFSEFAKALHFKTEAPQNFTPTGYHDLLKAHGPLWVGSRLDAATAKSRRHIRVLRGVTGDGTSAGSTAWVLDPDGGKDYQSTMPKFSMELEQIAKEEIGAGQDLYPQIIRLA